MRTLALVAIAVMLTSCVPVPTQTHAYVGNALWFAASSYAFISANERECDYVSNDPDPWGAAFDSLIVNGSCEAGKDIEMKTAEVVMVAAIIGVARTLYKTYQPPAKTKTPRSR